MDATQPPVNRPRPRRFGLMTLSSALLVVWGIGAGMAFARTYIRSQRGSLYWSNGYYRPWLEGLSQSILAGVLLVFGLALLVETIRDRASPRPWGLGRVTIAVAALFVAFQWAAVIVSVEASSIRRTPLATCAWSVVERDPDAWTRGLLQDFFPALVAVWVTWSFSGRTIRRDLDMEEVVGWLIGLACLGSFTTQLFLP